MYSIDTSHNIIMHIIQQVNIKVFPNSSGTDVIVNNNLANSHMQFLIVTAEPVLRVA